MKNELQKARATVDKVNARMARLFEKRMNAVRRIGAYKKAHGIPVSDIQREEAVLRAAEESITDPSLRPYFCRVMRTVMDVAKDYQEAQTEEKS